MFIYSNKKNDKLINDLYFELIFGINNIFTKLNFFNYGYK